MSPAPRRTVALVTTTGGGSMDRYGDRLAESLDVPRLRIAKERTSCEDFGLGWWRAGTVRELGGDARVVGSLRRSLRRLDAVAHLTHHHTARYGPLLGRPYLLTVHDLIRWYDAQLPARRRPAAGGAAPYISTPTRRDRFWLGRDHAAIRRAAGVVAVSETTRRDLVRHLGVAPERIRVVHEGLDHELFRPAARRLVDPAYLLFVGSEHPRKNFGAALQAFAELRRERRYAGLRLVKVGAAGTAEAPFRAAALRQLDELGLRAAFVRGDELAAGTPPADVIVVDEEVPDEDLPAYYAGAACFVLPSRYEGFGFTPLEAMACGCPSVVSDAGSLPEVTGGASLLVPPEDVPALVAALRRVLDEPGLADELRERGLARAAHFSWRRTAKETAQAHDELLAGAGVR